MKNDITYEYRVFTHRLFDVESMEVGICTSKVIKEIKPKDKVNGRFFHTSDTDEWFFCWNNELQKLNLKGNSDVNAALEKVNKLIAEANTAVDEAKKTAGEAKDAATAAAIAADAATAAVESIENKADKSDVEAVSKAVENKADKSVVDTLSAKIDGIKVPSLEGYATEEFVSTEIAKINIPEIPTNVSAFTNDAGYLTEHQDISGKQDVITDLSDIRSGATLGATALQEVPAEYITETELEGKGYLTVADADLKYAPIGSEGADLSDYATKEFVGEEIAKINIPEIPTNVSAFTNDAGYLTEHQDITGKQDTIDDLEDIRANAAKGATALQEVPAEYVTETELEGKGYLTEHQSLDDYYTKQEVNDMIGDINELIGQATEITNEILA